MKKKNIIHSVTVNYEFTDFERKVEDFHWNFWPTHEEFDLNEKWKSYEINAKQK